LKTKRYWKPKIDVNGPQFYFLSQLTSFHVRSHTVYQRLANVIFQLNLTSILVYVYR